MKTLFSVVFTMFFSFVFSQNKEIDTAQVIIPNRGNSTEALSKPYVIFISIDGFRYDYAQKHRAENLLRLSKNGVSAKAMTPSFPSITFPNHWTLITGLYPSHHGLVDNFFYDDKRKKSYEMSNKTNAEDGSWYGGTPLWSLAEKQGVLSASLHWVGSASDAGGSRPTYYYHYHEKFSPQEKVEKVISWLKLSEEKRPHFISLYFPDVDANGHYYGTDAQETQNAVRMVDEAIGELNEKVNTLGLKNVNFIIVSDHGMTNIDDENPLEIPEMLLNQDRFSIHNSQTLLRVFVKNTSEAKSVFKTLKKNKSSNYSVIWSKRFPRKLHYRQKDDHYNRIGQIMLVPNAPYVFLEKGKKTKKGKHGYNPYITPEMKAIFYAWGDVFKQNKEIDEFQNVNVYPLVAEILGLKIEGKIDGKKEALEEILKK